MNFPEKFISYEDTKISYQVMQVKVTRDLIQIHWKKGVHLKKEIKKVDQLRTLKTSKKDLDFDRLSKLVDHKLIKCLRFSKTKRRWSKIIE